MKSILTFVCLLALTSCKTDSDTKPTQTPTQVDNLAPAPKLDACETVKESIWVTKGSSSKEIKLPKAGKFVLESHLASKEDGFADGRIFPKTTAEGINTHLEKSCQILKSISGNLDCLTVYKTKYHKVWTPAEGGKAGQGSVGDLKPSLREEMFSGNMMWDKQSKPSAGTKFVAKFKGKAVVFVMGYETGPADLNKWLGGLQGEVFYYLNATAKDDIEIGRLKDQSLEVGPVSCD